MLYQFVRDSLENGWQPFELMAPAGQKLKDDESMALNECNLVGKEHKSLLRNKQMKNLEF